MPTTVSFSHVTFWKFVLSNTFFLLAVNGLNFETYIQNGILNTTNAANALCLFYEFVGFTPGELGNVLNIPVDLANVIVEKAAPYLTDLGCGINPNNGSSVAGN